jgi:hypothetical protein
MTTEKATQSPVKIRAANRRMARCNAGSAPRIRPLAGSPERDQQNIAARVLQLRRTKRGTDPYSLSPSSPITIRRGIPKRH